MEFVPAYSSEEFITAYFSSNYWFDEGLLASFLVLVWYSRSLGWCELDVVGVGIGICILGRDLFRHEKEWNE